MFAGDGDLYANYIFRPITIDDGLSNFVVSAFYKDSTGYMWIGTDNCLDRFDGINFKHYYFNIEVHLNLKVIVY